MSSILHRQMELTHWLSSSPQNSMCLPFILLLVLYRVVSLALSLDVEGGGGPFRPGGSGTSTSVGQTWHGRGLPSLQLWRLLPSLQLRRVFEPRSALSPSDDRVQPPPL